MRFQLGPQIVLKYDCDYKGHLFFQSEIMTNYSADMNAVADKKNAINFSWILNVRYLPTCPNNC